MIAMKRGAIGRNTLLSLDEIKIDETPEQAFVHFYTAS